MPFLRKEVYMHPTFGEEDKIHGEPAAVPKTTRAKVANFFYHYKWIALITAVLLCAGIICTVQICNRTSYDIYVMYAGTRSIMSTQSHTIAGTLADVADDYDGDGKKNISFYPLYIADIDALTSEKNPNSGYLAAESKKNYDTFTSEIQTGNYLICMLSPKLFSSLDEEGIFLPVAEFSDTVPDAALCGKNKTGVRLSALGIYAAPGFSSLPADTILCIRQPSAVSGWFTGKNDTSNPEWWRDTDQYKHHADMFRRLLTYVPAES